MASDPELIKQLVDIFQVELEDKLQIITDGLLKLEKNNLDENELTKTIEMIFRAAHNIKGTAQGIGIMDVGEISHAVETLFLAIKKKTILITPALITICLEAVDKIRLAMQAFVDKTPISFNIKAFLENLNKNSDSSAEISSSVKPTEEAALPKLSKKVEKKIGGGITPTKSIHVSLDSLDKVSALMEEMQINKISIIEHYHEINKLFHVMKRFNHLWKESHLLLRQYLGQEWDEFSKINKESVDILYEMNQITDALHKKMEVEVTELSMISNSLQEEFR